MKTNFRMIVFLMTMVSANVVHGQSNLLPNGDFSNSLGISGWTPVGKGSVVYNGSIDADDAPASGAMLLNYPDKNDPENAISECFSVTAGASYRFGGKYKSGSVLMIIGGAQMMCSSFSDASCTSNGTSLGVANNFDEQLFSFASWNPVSGTLSSNAKAVQCTVSTSEGSNGGLGFSEGSQANVDDLYFTLVTGAPISLGGYLSGSWYDPSTSGQGFELEFTAQGNTLLATWFTYSPDGSGTTQWVYGQGIYDPMQRSVTIPAVLTSGPAFLPNFIPAQVQKTPWGNLTFTFYDCDHATMSWSSVLPSYGSGTQQLQRLTSIAGLSCPQ